MEEQPHNPEDHEPGQLPPGEEAADPGGGERPPSVTVEFGELHHIPPKGESWSEWVIIRGLAEAEHEERAVDHRTAFYIAEFVKKASTPALRKLAATGEVDLVALQEETTSLYSGQSGQVQSWMAWLAHYCRSRAGRGPVADWRENIERHDQAEIERLRHERVMQLAEDFFESVPAPEVEAAKERDLFAVVRYIDSFGGLILHQTATGDRSVWATDSEVELNDRWAEIAARSPEQPQQGWLYRLSADQGGTGERPDSPHDPSALPDR